MASSSALCDERVVITTIDKSLHGAECAALALALETWSFSPYPPCPRERLRDVDVFLVARQKKDETTTNKDTTSANARCASMEDVLGTIGIVWVPLSFGATAEGYLQVVLVDKAHRGRGVGRKLLKAWGAMRTTADGRVVMRWRLHTMAPSAKTSAYLRELQRDGGEEAEAAERLIAAVPRMYASLGFEVRRNVYAYYDKRADAVEMVCIVPGARKGWMVQTREANNKE